MCGIFAVLHPNVPESTLIDGFMKGKHRGPEHTDFVKITSDVWFGFHRLAINGLDTKSNQPFSQNGHHVICNGEIYNTPELYEIMEYTPFSSSDCEVLLPLYHQFGIEHTLHSINASEFACVLYDHHTNTVYAARDPYGVRPLYHGVLGDMHIFCSELKMISEYVNMQVEVVLPGTYITYHNGVCTTHTYISKPCINYSIQDPCLAIRNSLYEAVRQRVINTNRPIACLLSGGLDSSLITALVVECRQKLGYTDPLETYSIGLEGAEDLKYATIVADFLGTKHTTVVVSESDFLNAIPEVIYNIESYDTTTVRASVGNYLIAKYIAANSEAKVIFNGDGSDEITGGYLYMKKAPNELEFDRECRRLVTDIHHFDALRSDKSISSNGLEARTPFLDKSFVQTYLSIPPYHRFPKNKCEKHLLRSCFIGCLPPEILWRKKEAFSDGVSSLDRSWYQIIQSVFPDEKEYYKYIYDTHYPITVLPYYWMPKYVNATDCSARTLTTDTFFV
jgi:asparagine synthase (glutamine-hydrolysing)